MTSEDLERSDVVTVPASKLKEMQEDVRWLKCLESCKVHQWDGFEGALELYEDYNNDE